MCRCRRQFFMVAFCILFFSCHADLGANVSVTKILRSWWFYCHALSQGSSRTTVKPTTKHNEPTKKPPSPINMIKIRFHIIVNHHDPSKKSTMNCNESTAKCSVNYRRSSPFLYSTASAMVNFAANGGDVVQQH